jgi:signal transduction histidine kinase
MFYLLGSKEKSSLQWYHSVKVKLVGFFLLISVVFLITILITFFVIREQNLLKDAAKEASLMTSEVLQSIKNKQTKAEENVLFLASVSSFFIQRPLDEKEIVSTLLLVHRYETLEIVSGGIWFEPGILESNSTGVEDTLFFARNKNHQMELVPHYAQQVNFRDMAFYKLARRTKPKETAWTEVYIDPVTHVKMITVISPIYRNDRFIGVASIDLSIDSEMHESMRQVQSVYPDHYLMMVDKEGNFIGKSSLIEKFTKEENIFNIKNDATKIILQYIYSSLQSGTSQRYCRVQTNVEGSKPLYMQKSIKENEEFSIKHTICMVDNDPIFHNDSIIVVYHFPRTHWNVIIGIPKEQVLASQNELFYKVLLITVFLTLFATVIAYFILDHIFVRPIKHVNHQLENASSENVLLNCSDKGEIGMLIENLNRRTIYLDKARKKEAKEYEMRIANEEMLMQQSKMAMMGEMMDSVAHQWKQPLNALTLYSELIRNDFEDGTVDKAYVEEFRKNLQVQIDHMVNTLDEFRSFFRPNKERETFTLINVLNSALFLAKDDILKHRILVKIIQEDEIEINGYPNELKHLILNIINNAKDAFVERGIEKRLVTIALIVSEEEQKLEICDNAGGVPQKVIDRIFEANVTTKEEGKGTGIGLYMSRKIAKKHHATLTVENREEGACFIVTFGKVFQDTAEIPAK